MPHLRRFFYCIGYFFWLLSAVYSLGLMRSVWSPVAVKKGAVRILPRFEGDTYALVRGAAGGLKCLKEGRGYCPELTHFPLFQYIPAAVAKMKGMDDTKVVRCLILLSGLSFFCILIFSLIFFFKNGDPELGIASALIFLGSPLVWYAHSSFNEVNAALVTLLFFIACHRPFPRWAIVLLFVGVGVTKETALPFALLLAGLPHLMGYFKGQAKGLPIRPILDLAIGTAVVIFLSGALNYWRFGSPINQIKLQSVYLVPDMIQQIKFFGALWFSPNGGLLFFWPSFLVLFFWVGTRELFRIKWSLLPWGVVGLILGGLTFGLSKWHAPFGWVAWGSRLTYPWIPVLAVLLLFYYRNLLLEFFGSLRKSPARFLLFSVILSFLSTLQWLALFDPEPIDLFFAPNSECMSAPQIEMQQREYYDCLNHLMWPKVLYLPLILAKRAVHYPYSIPFLAYFYLIFGLCCALVYWRQVVLEFKDVFKRGIVAYLFR